MDKILNPQNYSDHVTQKMPKSQLFSECTRAFVCGGAICVIGQTITDGAKAWLMLDQLTAQTFTAVVLVFLGALTTGLGLYSSIGKFAGAGSIVPITGFANSIVAPAMEFKREGYVLGVGAKMFTIAGPVLVYGIATSAIAGLISLLLGGNG